MDQRYTTVLHPFFRNHPGEPVPEENFWTLWCKGKLTQADTLTIQTNQYPPAPFPRIFYRADAFLPPNQQRQSTEGN